jgi:hypothetical protein
MPIRMPLGATSSLIATPAGADGLGDLADAALHKPGNPLGQSQAGAAASLGRGGTRSPRGPGPLRTPGR